MKEIKTVYVPVNNETRSTNVFGIVKPIDKSFVKFVEEQHLITFTLEEYNKHIQEVINDALYQATQFVELQYECGKKTKEGCVAVFCNNCLEQVDNSSIYSTFDKIFEKWKI